MVTNLFKALCFLLLLLLLCFSAFAYAYANDEAILIPDNNGAKLFKTEPITEALNPEGNSKVSLDKVDAYYSPSLVSTNDMMIAVAGVNRTDDSKENVDILTKYIEIKDGWDEKDVVTDRHWTTQFAVQQEVDSRAYNYTVKDVFAVAKQNKIYLLLMNYKTSKSPLTTPELELKLVVGSVKNETKEIEWQKDTSTVKVTEEFRKRLSNNLSSNFFSGTAFLTKEGNIVFVLVVDNAGQIMTALIYSNNSDTELNFMYKENGESCYPYYFPLAGKIFMLSVDCFGDDNKTMELSAIGQQWYESKTLLFQQHEFFMKKFDFVTVAIEGKDILLFMQQNKRINRKADRGEFLLWFSDGTRASCVGTVGADIKDRHGESFFYTNNSLFLLLSRRKSYKQNAVGEVFLLPLKKQLDKINSTLKAWNKSDETVLELLKKDATTENLFPTDGPVGFLYNTTDGNFNRSIWKDEYYYTNAVVINGQKTPNGFKFNKAGAGAIWPVKKAAEEQPYNFSDPGFTLVATVTLGNNSTRDTGNSSVLGVVFKPTGCDEQATKSIRLWCTTNGQWGVNSEKYNNEKRSGKKCVKGKTYSVALVLNNTEISFYVNGTKLTGPCGELRKINKREKIVYFYFGADSDTQPSTETDVTIANVLLYNRPFTEEELPPPTAEDSAARVGVVGVLCFMLFGVFTLLGRYVY